MRSKMVLHICSFYKLNENWPVLVDFVYGASCCIYFLNRYTIVLIIYVPFSIVCTERSLKFLLLYSSAIFCL
jgi:hypothetical protein